MSGRSYKSLKTSQRTKYSIQKGFYFLPKKSYKNIKCSIRSNEFGLDSCRKNPKIK
jgi:hypothetical protein